MTDRRTRTRLPDRRDSETRSIEVAGRVYSVGVGLDAKGRPRELFIRDGCPGSQIDTLLDDASVVISIALQHGIAAADLARSMGRLPVAPVKPADLAGPTEPGPRQAASVIGAALDVLTELEGAA